ncbi:MAG: nitrogenase [Spirochaetales bacterium]|nr:nitrogenase [Spirochaetales bacterium]
MKQINSYVSTINPCKVCAPLGASLAIKGIEGAFGIMHGSQGCATYIRRYMISHFREPFDIASSGFDESAAIFGGKEKLGMAIRNVIDGYQPRLIAVSTTCLSETIGDDIRSYCRDFSREFGIPVIPLSTPSYSGAHLDGFYTAVRGIVAGMATRDSKLQDINLFAGFVSAEDLRFFHNAAASMGLVHALVPDFSETLDGGIWGEYVAMAPGGTGVEALQASPQAGLSLSFSPFLTDSLSAAKFLELEYGTEHRRLYPQFGVRRTDEFFTALGSVSGEETPESYMQQRSRTIDAYADCHKYLFEKRAVVFGDADFVAGMAGFLDEIGIIPLVCAAGSRFGNFTDYVRSSLEFSEPDYISDDTDFDTLEGIIMKCIAAGKKPDLLVGNSKGCPVARKLGVPLVRAGFPIHDRVGGPRILHYGYEGAVRMLDAIVNTILDKQQSDSAVGYSYL